MTTLHALPLPASAAAGVTWFDTATGKPLSGGGGRPVGSPPPPPGDVVFAAPAFTTDAAALALTEPAAQPATAATGQ